MQTLIRSSFVLCVFLSAHCAIAATWQNPSNPFDVNASSVANTQDLLFVVNRHLLHGPGPLAAPPTEPPPPYLDVTGDDFLSSIDSLLIINHLFAEGGASPSPADTAQLRLAVTDAIGNPITTASAGDTFYLRLYANDNRAVPTEVYSANANIAFNGALANAVSHAPFDDQWNSMPVGVGTPGLLQAAGGVTFHTVPSGGGWQVIDSFQMLATSPGIVDFTLGLGDGPLYDLLLWGVNDPLPIEQIALLGTTLEIVPEPSAWLLASLAGLTMLALRRGRRNAH